MNTSYKAAFFWLIIGLCFLMHGYYELSEIRFGIDIKAKGANGTVPVSLHVIRIVLEIGSILMAVITLQLSARWFRWFAFVWAVLLVLLNTFHLGGMVLHEYTNYGQVALLSLILYVNILLALELRPKRV